MANAETQLVDDIIVKSRRKMLTLGATSLAGMLIGGATEAKAATATYTDFDILNFALNLEYLEASFYYAAAFGTTIDVANAASTAAGAPLIKLTGTVGTPGVVTGGTKVPFTTIQVASYAIETAVEEGKHVATLLSALGPTIAAAQPAINIGVGATGAFGQLGANLSPAAPTFTPYDNDYDFLLGAYIFEDVGVTAYHGAASLITGTTTILPVAAGILAVEAYHAGLVRTTINYIDTDPNSTTKGALTAVTNSISTLRAALAKAALFGQTPTGTFTGYDNQPDDTGLATKQVSLAGGASVTATNLTDADPTNVVAFARNTTQVLNIVTGGGAAPAGATVAVSPAVGVFFPAGMNAGPNGFR